MSVVRIKILKVEEVGIISNLKEMAEKGKTKEFWFICQSILQNQALGGKVTDSQLIPLPESSSLTPILPPMFVPPCHIQRYVIGVIILGRL